jgi:hypothetical protein
MCAPIKSEVAACNGTTLIDIIISLSLFDSRKFRATAHGRAVREMYCSLIDMQFGGAKDIFASARPTVTNLYQVPTAYTTEIVLN